MHYNSVNAVTERFIGWMTVALGLGALVPRPGLELYSLLEAGGFRAWVGAAMLMVGLALALCSFLENYLCRVLLLVSAMLLWTALAFLFVRGELWGATCQAIVVIVFANGCAWRLWRNRE